MEWQVAALLGAGGGAIVELLVLYQSLAAWRAARRRTLRKGGRRLPRLRRYIDPPADAAAGLTRVLLGSVAGLLFHQQITGALAAITVGAAAPLLLHQLGSVPSARGLVQGGDAAGLADRPAAGGAPPPAPPPNGEVRAGATPPELAGQQGVPE